MLSTDQIDDVVIISPVDHVNYCVCVIHMHSSAQSSSNVPIMRMHNTPQSVGDVTYSFSFRLASGNIMRDAHTTSHSSLQWFNRMTCAARLLTVGAKPCVMFWSCRAAVVCQMIPTCVSQGQPSASLFNIYIPSQTAERLSGYVKVAVGTTETAAFQWKSNTYS